MVMSLSFISRDSRAAIGLNIEEYMSVEKLMTQSIVTVGMDDSLKEIKEIFENVRFHHLLVVESKRLVGVISDRDLLKSISPNIGTPSETKKDLATLNKKAHQILTRKPITLTIDAQVDEAIDIFNTHRISCIPIVNDKQEPVGLLSWRDILKIVKVTRRSKK